MRRRSSSRSASPSAVRWACKAGLERLRTAHGALKAEALTRAQLATLHSSLRATPYQANRVLAAWRKLYSWAETRDFVPEGRNPGQKIEPFREQARERFLTTDELGRLGDALRLCEQRGVDPFAVAAVRLLIMTGARQSRRRRQEHGRYGLARGRGAIRTHGVVVKPGRWLTFLPPGRRSSN